MASRSANPSAVVWSFFSNFRRAISCTSSRSFFSYCSKLSASSDCSFISLSSASSHSLSSASLSSFLAIDRHRERKRRLPWLESHPSIPRSTRSFRQISPCFSTGGDPDPRPAGQDTSARATCPWQVPAPSGRWTVTACGPAPRRGRSRSIRRPTGLGQPRAPWPPPRWRGCPHAPPAYHQEKSFVEGRGGRAGRRTGAPTPTSASPSRKIFLAAGPVSAVDRRAMSPMTPRARRSKPRWAARAESPHPRAQSPRSRAVHRGGSGDRPPGRRRHRASSQRPRPRDDATGTRDSCPGSDPIWSPTPTRSPACRRRGTASRTSRGPRSGCARASSSRTCCAAARAPARRAWRRACRRPGPGRGAG